MTAVDAKIVEYRRRHGGYLRILEACIHQVPYELGESRQSLVISLLEEDHAHKLSTRFTNVVQLKIDQIHPGCSCHLQIVSVAADQLEGLRYHVFNDEQDVTISFYCHDFETIRAPVEGD